MYLSEKLFFIILTYEILLNLKSSKKQTNVNSLYKSPNEQVRIIPQVAFGIGTKLMARSNRKV